MLNLTGIDSINDFRRYAEDNNLKPGHYFKVRRNAHIDEFLLTVDNKVRWINYNPIHLHYDIALLRAQRSENTFIEGE